MPSGAFPGLSPRLSRLRVPPPIQNPPWPITRSVAWRKSSTEPRRTCTWTATPRTTRRTPRTTRARPSWTRTCSTTSPWTPPSGVTSCGGARTGRRAARLAIYHSPFSPDLSTRRTPRSRSSRGASPARARPRRAWRTCAPPRRPRRPSTATTTTEARGSEHPPAERCSTASRAGHQSPPSPGPWPRRRPPRRCRRLSSGRRSPSRRR
mmetsp:Transcript_9102/g.41321  ORF Transcript_9102/g.41321 Transcript_9102/m.41321 type:complete len:208 (+) Transcript_9102:289-912(+)